MNRFTLGVGAIVFVLAVVTPLTTRLRCTSPRVKEGSPVRLDEYVGPITCTYSALLGLVAASHAGACTRGAVFASRRANVTDDGVVYTGEVADARPAGRGTAALDLPRAAARDAGIFAAIATAALGRADRLGVLEGPGGPEALRQRGGLDAAIREADGAAPPFPLSLLWGSAGRDVPRWLETEVERRALLVRGSWAAGLPQGNATVSFPPVPGAWYAALAGRAGVFGSVVEGTFDAGVLEGPVTITLGPAAAVLTGSARNGWFEGMVSIDPFGGLTAGGRGARQAPPSLIPTSLEPLGANAGLDEETSSFVMVVGGRSDMYSVNCSVSHVLGVGCATQLAKEQSCGPDSECAKIFEIVHDASQVLLALYLNVKMRLAPSPFPWARHVDTVHHSD
jgi:hypothetical protein